MAAGAAETTPLATAGAPMAGWAMLAAMVLMMASAMRAGGAKKIRA